MPCGSFSGNMAFHINREGIVFQTKRALFCDSIDHSAIGKKTTDPRLGQPRRQRIAPRWFAGQIDRTSNPISHHPVADCEAIDKCASKPKADDPLGTASGRLKRRRKTCRIPAPGYRPHT